MHLLLYNNLKILYKRIFFLLLKRFFLLEQNLISLSKYDYRLIILLQCILTFKYVFFFN